MRAVQLTETVEKGPDLKASSVVKIPEIGDNQVLVRNEFASVNFIDVYHRRGVYPRLSNTLKSFILGVDGAGIIEKIGRDVKTLKIGARVAYFSLESYAEFTAVDENRVVPVPEEIALDVANALMTQGLTAHYLARSTFPLTKDSICLIHAASGGTGQILLQIAKIIGAKVIATCSERKIEISKRLGADIVIPYDKCDSAQIVAKVKEETDGRGVHVAYDGVGLSTYETSIKCLRPRGMLVLFGNASGSVPPIDPLSLSAAGSIFLTRPSLGAYISDRDELNLRANDLFRWVREKKLKVNIQKVFPLEEAGNAHEFLESGQSEGKLLLKL